MKHACIVLSLLLLLWGLVSCNRSNNDSTDVPTATEPSVSIHVDATEQTDNTHTSVTEAPEQTACAHTAVTDAAVAATCKSTGLTKGSHCSTCGKVLQAQTVIPKTHDHKFVRSNDYMSYSCSQCNLMVVSHGNADGSLSGGNSKVKYYVIGNPYVDGYYEIVIHGSGAMPDFSKTDLPMWYDYLPQTSKVTVASGITTIGKYAFYYEENTTVSCSFVMSDTVKTIKTHAIGLKVKELTLGSGVETVEIFALPNLNSLYIPRSVKNLYLDALGNEVYYYEGTLEEFYQIKLYVYNKPITVKEYLATADEGFLSNIHVYLNAKSISDRSNYWR